MFEDEVIKTLLASLGPTESVDPEQVQDVKHLFQVCAKDLLKKCPVIFAAYTATFFRHQPATFHSLIPWIKILQRRRRIWADLRNKAHVPRYEEQWHHYIQKYPQHHQDHLEPFVIIYEFAPFLTYYRTITHDYIQLMIPAISDPRGVSELPRFLNELLDMQAAINELLLPIWFEEE